jgi:hypothetical protein
MLNGFLSLEEIIRRPSTFAARTGCISWSRDPDRKISTFASYAKEWSHIFRRTKRSMVKDNRGISWVALCYDLQDLIVL